MNKKFVPTEEQLTAWVLGELDPAEAKQVAEAVNRDAKLSALADEIRATIELSEAAFAELHVADAPALSESQEAEIGVAAEKIVIMPMSKSVWPRRLVQLGAMAAGLAVVVSLGMPALSRSSENSRRASLENEKKQRELEQRMLMAESSQAGAVTQEELNRLRSLGYLGDSEVETETTARQTPLPELDESRYGNDLSATGEAVAEKEEGKKAKDDSVPFFDDPASTPSRAIRPVVREDMDQLRSLGYLDSTPSAGGAAGAPGTQVAAADPTALNAPVRTKTAEEAWADGESVSLGQLQEMGNRLRAQGYDVDSGINRPVRPKNTIPKFWYKEEAYNNGTSPDGINFSVPESDQFGLGTPQDEEAIRARVRAIGAEQERVAKQQAANNAVSADGRYRTADVPDQQWRYVAPQAPVTPGTEDYERFVDNTFKAVGQHPLSTFSIDVDTASYANVRRFLNQGSLPPVDAVRTEELINYFNYNYAGPTGEDPFAVHLEVGSAPWRPEHQLVRVGLKGQEMVTEDRPNSNLVFLLDVSGSMNNPNKLPLVKQSIRMLTQQLDERDRVAIVVYAGSSGLVLPSTSVADERTILDAVERLSAGGSTNGGAGIELAYKVASENFIEGGVNRVILATDGDFNVGVTNRNSLVDLIERKAQSGVFLSVLGFGMGNLKDATMEKLADKGNGNYAYIDTFREAKKVLVDEMSGTLVTIAKDVKIQVEFNPAKVRAYRLIGYENRALANRDFNDDTKDAGEIGAGHTVTALYEIVPTGVVTQAGVDPLRYREVPETTVAPNADVAPAVSDEMLTVKLRYKQPDGSTSKLLTFHLSDDELGRQPSTDFQFATAVAAFGQKLRQSPHVNQLDYRELIQLAEAGMGADLNGYRAEFLDLVRKAWSQTPQPRATRGQF